jgi:hypothetical protein
VQERRLPGSPGKAQRDAVSGSTRLPSSSLAHTLFPTTTFPANKSNSHSRRFDAYPELVTHQNLLSLKQTCDEYFMEL